MAAAAGIAVETELLPGGVGPAVLDAARAGEADLVIVGKSARSATGEPYVGTQTRHILEFSQRPVLLVPPVGRERGCAGASSCTTRATTPAPGLSALTLPCCLGPQWSRSVDAVVPDGEAVGEGAGPSVRLPHSASRPGTSPPWRGGAESNPAATLSDLATRPSMPRSLWASASHLSRVASRPPSTTCIEEADGDGSVR